MPITPPASYAYGIKFNLPIRAGSALKMHDLVFFCHKIAFLLAAGTPVKPALAMLKKQASSPALTKAAEKIHAGVNQGESLSAALSDAGCFPPLLSGYAAIGEKTAKLPLVFSHLANYYESKMQSQKELSAALMYPLAISVMMTAVIILAVTFVLPGYSRIFEVSNVAVPTVTQVLLDISYFLTENAVLVISGVFLFVLLIFAFFKTHKGRHFLSWCKIKIPITRLGINRNLSQAIYIMLDAGVSMSDAVTICKEITDNTIVIGDLRRATTQINEGSTFYHALNQIGYIDPMFAELVQTGENIGNLPHTTQKAYAYLNDRFTHELKNLNKLVEPAVTLVLGGILAVVMLAVIMPTFQLATVI